MFAEEKRLQKQKQLRGKRKSRGQGCGPKATERRLRLVSASRVRPQGRNSLVVATFGGQGQANPYCVSFECGRFMGSPLTPHPPHPISRFPGHIFQGLAVAEAQWVGASLKYLIIQQIR